MQGDLNNSPPLESRLYFWISILTRVELPYVC